jgi:outer membrane protein OmpA-like peptidoglycan-associated protein
MKSKILVALAATLALSACTTTNPYTGQSQLSNTTGGALIGTGGGAIAGALVGAAVGGDPRIGALIGAGVGGLTGAAIGSYMDQQEAELRAQLQGTGVSVTRVGQQIVLNMPSNITFATDQVDGEPGLQLDAGLGRARAQEVRQVDRRRVWPHRQPGRRCLQSRASASVVPCRWRPSWPIRASTSAASTSRARANPPRSPATPPKPGRAQNRRVEIQIAPING